MTSKNFDIKDIPMGTCCNCGYVQKKPASEGYWINGTGKRWACRACKRGLGGKGNGIASYPMGCEWCTSSDVRWAQCHAYHCYRCHDLKIGQAIDSDDD